MYEEAKLAYVANDLGKVKELLTPFCRVYPHHRPAALMLRQVEIILAAEEREAATLPGQMKRVQLDKFEVVESPLDEVLDFLRSKVNEKGPTKLNLVTRLEAADARRKISLSLQNISVYDALKAVAGSAGLHLSFDTHTVKLISPSLVPPETKTE